MSETKNKKRRWTKSEAIAEHRKMWHWIGDNLKATKDTAVNLSPSELIGRLKRKYCDINALSCTHNCVCCEYDCQVNGFAGYYRCTNCLVIWGTENDCVNGFYCENELSLYHKIKETYDINEQVKMAHQIAELYESPNDYDDILE